MILWSILSNINPLVELDRIASREINPIGTSVNFRPTHKQNKVICRIGTRKWIISILKLEINFLIKTLFYITHTMDFVEI